MNYIHITKENIDREHICCAMSGKQSLAKKEWLRQRFDEGLVFYRSEERGKCFIEYIPAENAWVPRSCFPSASGTLRHRAKRAFASFALRDGSGSFSPTRNSLLIRGSVWQTYPTVGSI